MTWVKILVFLQVIGAMMVVAGIFGSQIVRMQVQLASDLDTFILKVNCVSTS